ncbi:PQQ-binding-like beta-propeller repeat protein, partial [Dyadobacter jejuensis]
MNTIIIFAAALFSCKNDFDLPLYPTYEWTNPLCDTTLKVVWQKIISKDSSYGAARFFSENGHYIYKYVSDYDKEVKAGFFEFDGNNIHELWEIRPDVPNGKWVFYGFPSFSDFLLLKNKFIYSDGRTLYSYTYQGDLIWENKFAGVENKGNVNSFLSGFGNKVYISSRSGGSVHRRYLFEVDIDTGKERLLYTELEDNNFIGLFDPPVLYMHENDTIATFQIRKYSQIDSHNRADMVAFNISKKEIMWRVDSLDRYTMGSANPILIENNKLYYAGAFDIYCLDPFTGKLIWRQSFDDY